MKHAGNSGGFLWAMPKSIENLEAGKGRLPAGIDVQVLDLGYETNWEESKGKPSEWFTSHVDVFPTGRARMKPFMPEIVYTRADGTKYLSLIHISEPTRPRRMSYAVFSL